MDWLCPAIGVLAIVLFIVTLVGHGIWVLIARLFGGSRRTPYREQTPSAAPLPGSREALATTRREIERMRRLNYLDAETSGKVLQAIDAREFGTPVEQFEIR